MRPSYFIIPECAARNVQSEISSLMRTAFSSGVLVGFVENERQMRAFCWSCHRPSQVCFCHLARPFEASADLAMIVHPNEVNSTVGTAWILRRSISNLTWIRSNGDQLDHHPGLKQVLESPATVPFLLFPGATALNLNSITEEKWRSVVTPSKRPLFIVIDGSWSEARGILRKSALLQSLPKASFEPTQPSEYGFKKQPHPACLSCVEGVHRVLEILASRGWGSLPAGREHDQMIEIFRSMIEFQTHQNPLKRP
jgi:DTW domain-containing protein YfiP